MSVFVADAAGVETVDDDFDDVGGYRDHELLEDVYLENISV